MPISNAGTGSSFAAVQTNATHPYFSFPFSLEKLPPVLEKGLLAPGIMGLVSLLSSFGLLCFLLSKFFEWKKSAKSYLGYNQYLVLFINLLIADIQQSLAFVISFHWMATGSIMAPTRACFVQGWILNIGDVSSGLFVLFIAGHTFYTTLVGRRLDYRIFLGLVLFTWIFSLFLTFIGPAIHGRTYFVRTGAWCWVSALYESERLAVHYIWIFLVQAGSIIIYLILFIHVKSTIARTMSIVMANQAQTATHRKINRAARAMVLYPIFYIILTLPLSAGRMWSLAHNGAFLPNWYLLIAGTLMASSGFVDAILYALTRRNLMHTGSTQGGGETTIATTAKSRATSISKAAVPRPSMARSKSYNVQASMPPEQQVGWVEKGIKVQHRVSIAVTQADYVVKEKRCSSVPVLPRHGLLLPGDRERGSESSASSDGSQVRREASVDLEKGEHEQVGEAGEREK
ncbi:G protein-coupled glucose receptor regulating Gpa2-domain-containing protein [Elsinoe ampelina]|uniref:G protein-coupled glucose receptor regulating Gpa2-domain-containing protein n=1 Tax=Elsinoe ampelina TaxID=302913 RepID=A0A6A6GI20_9PEZI|nr:G protein-coupled glucose receptor regulating Gpa2-domain-containing protein [Elsinoe ampelina]